MNSNGGGNSSVAVSTTINGGYHRFNNSTAIDDHHHHPLSEVSSPLLADDNNTDDQRTGNSWTSKWMWLKIFVVCAVLAVPVVLVVKFYDPIMEKVVIPTVEWLINTYSPPVIAAIVFAAIALLPIVLLPTMPFQWVAGMTFGYGIGFLLLIAGAAVAVTLPYIIGCHLFYQTIKKWLDEHPRRGSIVRLAGDGNWAHQFRAIVLIRLTPFPYVVFNYAAVVTGVKFVPYLGGSLVGLVPEIFVAIYSGILIRRLVEAMESHVPVSKLQIIIDGIGFCLSVAAAIIIGFYAKRRLKQLQEKEQEHQQLPP